MKSRVLLAVAVLTLFSGCGADWKEFRPEGGNFSVSLPGAPKAMPQKIDTVAGKIDLKLYIVEQGQNSGFIASYADYPAGTVTAENVQQVLDGARQGAVANVKGKLRDEQKITVDGYHGRDLTVDAPQEIVIHQRVVMAGDRMVQLMVLSKKDTAADQFKKLFDSLKFDQENSQK